MHAVVFQSVFVTTVFLKKKVIRLLKKKVIGFPVTHTKHSSKLEIQKENDIYVHNN